MSKISSYPVTSTVASTDRLIGNISGVTKQIPIGLINLFEKVVALSDLSTALAVGATKGYWDASFNCFFTDVIITALTAPTGAILVVNVKKNGVTMMSTKPSIDATEVSSLTAATPAVFSAQTVAKGDRITFDIDQVGSSYAGAGLQATINGYRQ